MSSGMSILRLRIWRMSLGSWRAAFCPEVAATYGVNYSFVGAQKDEQQTAKDMVTGLFIAGLLIFVTLAAVFASWTLPIVIILTAPLAIIGAIFGHWIMDLEMSILSIFGIFTLSGIVINDSIVFGARLFGP